MSGRTPGTRRHRPRRAERPPRLWTRHRITFGPGPPRCVFVSTCLRLDVSPSWHVFVSACVRLGMCSRGRPRPGRCVEPANGSGHRGAGGTSRDDRCFTDGRGFVERYEERRRDSAGRTTTRTGVLDRDFDLPAGRHLDPRAAGRRARRGAHHGVALGADLTAAGRPAGGTTPGLQTREEREEYDQWGEHGQAGAQHHRRVHDHEQRTDTHRPGGQRAWCILPLPLHGRGL